MEFLVFIIIIILGGVKIFKIETDSIDLFFVISMIVIILFF